MMCLGKEILGKPRSKKINENIKDKVKHKNLPCQNNENGKICVLKTEIEIK
jgi:hypothetical protein